VTTTTQPDMAALTEQVVARFAAELAEAGPAQLEHLAQRAEARYASDLGRRMRAMVDTERALRLLRALGDTGDQVADRLRTLGITGGQRLSHICPVAQYMAACRVPCFIGDTVFALAGHPDTWLPLPEPVIRFVWQFDAGIHLDLIDGGPA
jgi:predicted ArsR family transcriptional regulator